MAGAQRRRQPAQLRRRADRGGTRRESRSRCADRRSPSSRESRVSRCVRSPTGPSSGSRRRARHDRLPASARAGQPDAGVRHRGPCRPGAHRPGDRGRQGCHGRRSGGAGCRGRCSRGVPRPRPRDGSRTRRRRRRGHAATAKTSNCRDVSVNVDVSGFAQPVGTSGTVRATVSCAVDLRGLGVPGVPGQRTLEASAASALDRYRSR